MEGDRDPGQLTDSDLPGDRLAEVGIVGAGLAGTVLAIALKQSGLSVRLYDQPVESHRADAPVLLTANGARVLHAIGLKDDLSEFALLPQFSTLRHARTGFLLSQRPLGAFSEARYGAPDLLMNGARLIELLREKATSLGIAIEAQSTVSDVDAGTAMLTFANGNQRQHQCIAVACGLPECGENTGIADLLNDRDWSVSEDLIALMAVGPRARPNRDHDRFINTWLADGVIAIETPIPPDPETSHETDAQRVALTLLAPAAEINSTATEAEVQMRRLLERTHPHLRELIEEPEVSRLSQPVADVAEFWFAEKLVLLGGACHAHPDFPALNASAALEDAWILSRMMERWEEAPYEGFADYERYRKPRAKRLRAYAGAERAVLTERSGMAVWQRNLKWSLTSRFLPEISMQQTDWLYGYDCIKGFA